MFWVCLDDSAVHALGSQKLRRYALGGAVATFEVWQHVNRRWQARLHDLNNPSRIEWFHYTEWKRAYLGHAKHGAQFYGWSRPQLEQLLVDLATISSGGEIHYLCASVQAVESKRIVRDSYKEVVHHVIVRAEKILDWIGRDDEISFLFSSQAELAGIRIQRFFEFLKSAHPRTRYCVIGDPRKEVQLQVADLIVNHMARSRNMRMSYGPILLRPFMTEMMRLLKREPPFHHMIEWHKDDDLRGPEDES